VIVQATVRSRDSGRVRNANSAGRMKTKDGKLKSSTEMVQSLPLVQGLRSVFRALPATAVIHRQPMPDH
jgi:hypothetical protein